MSDGVAKISGKTMKSLGSELKNYTVRRWLYAIANSGIKEFSAALLGYRGDRLDKVTNS